MLKRIMVFLLALLLLCPAVLADEAPYTGYYYDSWGEIAQCPNIYVPDAEYAQGDMALKTALSNPSDLHIDEATGLIYIAEAEGKLMKACFRKGERTVWMLHNGSREDASVRLTCPACEMWDPFTGEIRAVGENAEVCIPALRSAFLVL